MREIFVDTLGKFIFLGGEYTNTPKFPRRERSLIKNIVANLTIKRIPDEDIIKVIAANTGKAITDRYLSMVRQAIKRESYHWYKQMREGEYEYIHDFKERINEILFLQKKHHQIVMRNEDNPQIQQTSLAELHRLTITLSNLWPVVLNDHNCNKLFLIEMTSRVLKNRLRCQHKSCTNRFYPPIRTLAL